VLVAASTMAEVSHAADRGRLSATRDRAVYAREDSSAGSNGANGPKPRDS